MNIWHNILKDYASVEEISKDASLQMCLIIGRTMVALVFTPIGFLCLLKAGTTGEKLGADRRKILTQLFGIFLIFCGLSRAIAAISPFHYFAWLDALLCISAGITGAIALFYIPFVIRAINQDITLTKLNEKINDTTEKLQQVKELGKRHTKKDK